MGTVTVSQTIRKPWKTSGFEEIVQDVLGSRYSLSVVLIGDKRALRLNRAHRKKDTPANVLTFPLTDIEGEIFINVDKAKREAKTFGFTQTEHIKYLLIHGCLHLKGYTHGSTMEKAEETLIKKYILR